MEALESHRLEGFFCFVSHRLQRHTLLAEKGWELASPYFVDDKSVLCRWQVPTLSLVSP